MLDKILAEFDEKFKCINSNCDNNGTIANQISEDEFEPQQCQYCFEVRFKQRDFLRSSLLSLLDDVDGKIDKMIRKVKPTHGTCCTCQTCGYPNDSV